MSLPSRILGRLRLRSERSFFVRRVLLPAQHYLRVEETAGWPIMAATVVALAWANWPGSESYRHIWETHLTLDLAIFQMDDTFRHWITDALMPLFFFVVGLEIKEEFIRGELAKWKRAALPLATAAGGMAVPAGVYLAVSTFLGGPIQGWGIPVATDIAFALGVLALLGDRVPHQLRILVVAFAAADDIGGVLIIAFYYSSSLSWLALGIAAGLFILMILLKRLGVRSTVLFVLLGVVFWGAMFKSGVHTTIAGVLLGLLAPARPDYRREEFHRQATNLGDRFEDALQHEREAQEHQDQNEHATHAEEEAQTARQEQAAALGQFEILARGTQSTTTRLTRLANPWVSYLVLPAFALSHAGVVLAPDAVMNAATNPASLGVAIGLVLGKPVGIIAAGAIVLWLGVAKLPENVNWRHLVGMGLLAGVGFTVSLFIAQLAFRGQGPLQPVKIGILAASAAAGVAGYLFLFFTARPSQANDE